MGRAVRAGLLAAVLSSVSPLLGLSAGAAELTGAWRGTVTLDGQSTEFTATFSENGYFLFTYTTNAGFVRTVELSGPGQIRFAPPGGGVMTLAVQSVERRPGGVAYVLRTGFERQTGSGVEKEYVLEEADYALTAAGLRVRIVSRPVSSLEDPGGSAGGSPGARVHEGLLKKLP
jgi:hypothetical protein